MRQIFGLNSQKATGDQSLVSFGEIVSYVGEELSGIRSEVECLMIFGKGSRYFGVECKTN